MPARVEDLELEIAGLRRERDALAAELELLRRYRQVVEEAPIGIAVVAAGKGRYIIANRTFAEYSGQPHEGILARDAFQVWTQAVRPEDIQAERAGVERLATGQIRALQVDSRLAPPEGKQRWVRKHIVGSGYVEGRLEHVTIYLQDIDQERLARGSRDQLTQQLQRAQKMEAVGSLVGGVVHDFNNRLVIIMGYCELLRAGLPAGSTLSAHADTILASAKGAAALTRQLLAYSRRQVLNPQPFDLNELVTRVEPVLKSVTGDRIELRMSLGARRNTLADAGQIEQVILNLVLNARDAMTGTTGGAKLTLETQDVVIGTGEIPGVASGEYVALVITDTGAGIPDHVLPRIFEPFFTTKEVGQGTGLGLAMVEGIVRQSGGWTQVESRVGEGSRFTIFLPQTRGSAVPPIPPVVEKAHPAAPRSFETVLVCDDNDSVREMLIGVLKLRGYTILEARDGAQALARARAHQGHIDLLLTDLAMPGMNGIELAGEMRRRDAGLRVLYMSGYAEDAELVSMSLGPRTYFVAKPFLPGELTRAVSSILEGRPTP